MASTTTQTSHAKVLNLAYIALMAALMAICAWITLPIGPVPFTMQTFGVFVAVGLLGGRRGTIAVLVYILLGAVGLPVFAGFNSGPSVLLGPTGGYLIGYLVGALLCWAITAKLGTATKVLAPAMILGLIVCYAFGTIWFLQVYTGGGSAATLTGALAMCVFPFVIPDLVKIALAVLITNRVGKYVAK